MRKAMKRAILHAQKCREEIMAEKNEKAHGQIRCSKVVP
jgi:hypothetical protein